MHHEHSALLVKAGQHEQLMSLLRAQRQGVCIVDFLLAAAITLLLRIS
jgi:hypothetical protein